MFSSLAVRIYRALLVGAAAVAVAGCSTTGNNFDTQDLRFLVPGETTLEEARVLLQADPVNVYRQADGAATARWAYGSSLVNDAVYFNRELWLAFDSYGRFERIVKSNNVPHAWLYENGRRVDLPPGPSPFPAAPGTAHYLAAPGTAHYSGAPAAPDAAYYPAASAARGTTQYPATPATAPTATPNPFSSTTVTYPVGQ